MRKLTTILLSLLMAFTLCLSVSAEDNNDDLSTQATNVAKIGDTEYATLQEAINNAESGATVTLISSTSVDEIKIEKDLTLDLNGYDISGLNKNIVLKNIAVTIKDSKAVGPTVNDDYSVNYQGGTITFVGSSRVGDRISIEDNAKLTVDSGHIKSTFVAFSVNGGSADSSPISSTVSINGGYIESQEGVGVFGNGAVLNVNGGVILAHDNASIAGNGTSEKGGTEINITGGTIIGNIQSAGYISMGIYHPQKGVLNITGGTIYSSNGNGICVRGGEVNISNATIIAKGTSSGKCGDSKVVTSSNAIFVNVEPNYYDAANIKVNIQGGNLNSDKEIIGVLGDISTDAITVSGGTFSSDVSKYLEEGNNVAKIGEKFIVVKDGEKAPVTEKVTPAVDEKVFDVVKDSNGDGTTAIVLESQEKQLNVDEKTIIDQKVKDDTTLKDKDVEYLPLDLTLVAYKGVERSEIHELSSPITVTLYLDDTTVAKLQGKTIKVARIHDGSVELLLATLNGNALIFETDKFSTYVIVYDATVTTPTTPVAPSTNNNKSYDPKDKNHDGIISCDEEMNSSNWVWSENKKACVYKVTNTSVR